MPTIVLMRAETIIVPSGATVSQPLFIQDVSIVGMMAPDVVDHNTLYFDVSIDGVRWCELSDMSGSPIRCTLARSSAVTFDALIFRPWWYARLRLNIAAAAERQYTALVRPAWGG